MTGLQAGLDNVLVDDQGGAQSLCCEARAFEEKGEGKDLGSLYLFLNHWRRNKAQFQPTARRPRTHCPAFALPSPFRLFVSQPQHLAASLTASLPLSFLFLLLSPSVGSRSLLERLFSRSIPYQPNTDHHNLNRLLDVNSSPFSASSSPSLTDSCFSTSPRANIPAPQH